MIWEENPYGNSTPCHCHATGVRRKPGRTSWTWHFCFTYQQNHVNLINAGFLLPQKIDTNKPTTISAHEVITLISAKHAVIWRANMFQMGFSACHLGTWLFISIQQSMSPDSILDDLASGFLEPLRYDSGEVKGGLWTAILRERKRPLSPWFC